MQDEIEPGTASQALEMPDLYTPQGYKMPRSEGFAPAGPLANTPYYREGADKAMKLAQEFEARRNKYMRASNLAARSQWEDERANAAVARERLEIMELMVRAHPLAGPLFFAATFYDEHGNDPNWREALAREGGEEALAWAASLAGLYAGAKVIPAAVKAAAPYVAAAVKASPKLLTALGATAAVGSTVEAAGEKKAIDFEKQPWRYFGMTKDQWDDLGGTGKGAEERGNKQRAELIARMRQETTVPSKEDLEQMGLSEQTWKGMPPEDRKARIGKLATERAEKFAAEAPYREQHPQLAFWGPYVAIGLESCFFGSAVRALGREHRLSSR
jgi:hypothetical protein